MRCSDLRHLSDSRYCFSLDERRVLLRLAVAKGEKLNKVEVVYGDPMGFARNHRYQKMTLAHTDVSFDYYETVVNAFPMRLMYVFLLGIDEGEFYYSETGLTSLYKFDLAFLSAYQYVGENRNDFVIDKPSWQGRVFYQIFPERFAAGLPREQKNYVNCPWDCTSLKGRHNAMLGGDLRGVIDKLDYLESLGVGVLYLTPIHPSLSNHKYDVLDYFDVDARFGGKQTFRELVQKAHEKGMKVMMDLVFNHCSSKNPIFLDVVQKGKASQYYSWFFIDGDKPHAHPLNYRCFGTYHGMPKFDTNNPEVQRYLISVALYWQKEFGVDGYRLDVSEGVSHDFWIRLKIALKDVDPEVLLLGENWLNSESYLGPDQLDGVMNYPFLGVVSSYVLGIRDAKETAEGLEGLLMRYKDGHNRMMLNILASHDIQRFTTLCKDDKDLSLMGYALMTFFPGYPMIYYGEEIFMAGAGDPDNRRGMDWGSEEFGSLRNSLFLELLLLRKERALRAGEVRIFESSGALCVERIDKGARYLLVCNYRQGNVRVPGTILFGNHVAGDSVWEHGFAVTRI